MNTERKIVAYVRRDDISWWAGCRYVEGSDFGARYYISETSCFTRWSATWKARRMAAAARRLRSRGLAGFEATIGDPS